MTRGAHGQSVVDTWKTPLKHDAVALLLRDGAVTCLGLDHEVASHAWDGGAAAKRSSRLDLNHHHVFRSRARWRGAAWAHANAPATCIGMDVAGALYLVDATPTGAAAAE